MKLIHTSDWHLGHSLRDWGREEEHRAFLAWLLERLVEEEADVLLVAGDLFDTSNPSAASQRMFYGFLARLRDLHPRTQVVLIGGNHDSGARLDAPEPLLSALSIRVIGSLPYHGEGRGLADLDLERLLVPLSDVAGNLQAWVAAVPYVRPADLPDELVGLNLQEAMAGLYQHLAVALEQRRAHGQALLATGHCFVAGSTASLGSERRLVGGDEQLPTTTFPECFVYVALGHLHRPQALKQRLFYSGAPLPFDMKEGAYPSRILVVELAGGELTQVRELRIPRWTEIQVEPTEGAMSVEAALAWAEGQPPMGDIPFWRRPLLELRVERASRHLGLWGRLSGILKDRVPRLVKLSDVWPEGERPREDHSLQLQDLRPEQVFERRWRQRYLDQELSEDLRGAFSELLLSAQQREP